MRSVLFFCALMTLLPLEAQTQLKGNWQGLMIRDGQSLDQATIVYFDFTDNGDFIGKSREEVTGKDMDVLYDTGRTRFEQARQGLDSPVARPTRP